jgi:hypothetical protein
MHCPRALPVCVLLSRWSFTVREFDPETDNAHTGASWITWLPTNRGVGGQENYRIFHHMESQVYLGEGFRNGPLPGPDDEPGR